MDTPNAAPTGAPAVTSGTTETVTATRVAAEAGDVSTFLEADRAARGGKPVEKITRAKTPDAAVSGRPAVQGKGGAPAKGPTPADADADARLTARIREAVDTSTADLRRQNEDLRKRLEPAAGKKEEAAPAGAAAEHKRYLAMPDAPKLADFDTTAEHTAALAVFINDKRHEERLEAGRQEATTLEKAKADIDRVKTFHGRIQEYKAVDPEFASKLTPEVKALHGFARLQQINAERAEAGQAELPATVDHAIAEEVYDSAVPAQMALHLSQNPADLATLRACKTPAALLKAFARLEDKVAGSAGADAASTSKQPTAAELRASAAAAVDRHVSKQDPPAPSLGKAGSGVNPLKRALDTGDVGAFLELDRQERAERRGLVR